MTTRNPQTVRAGTMLLVLAALFLGLAAAQPAKVLSEAKVADSVPAPAAIQGLSMADGVLWSIDAQKGVLTRIRVADKKVVGTLAIRVAKPRALAWDGKTLWCAGDDITKVQQVDPAEGKVLRTIEVAKPRTTSPISVEALAWDGKYLWVAYAAGWSSQLVRVDVASGRIVQSMFADGLPRGLASDGKSLWMATYNGGKAPSLLARWTILPDATKMSLTRTFVARLPGKDPVGLAWDSGAFWYADRELKVIQKVQLPAEP
ncbi:MAG: PQQ-binding-like beta-propeller repeat protein [Bryobacteraceae bacterium]